MGESAEIREEVVKAIKRIEVTILTRTTLIAAASWHS
jgi:hypothetical protein